MTNKQKSQVTRFETISAPIDGLKIVQRQAIGDNRGYFERMFCTYELKPIIGNRSIVQINHTLTKKVGTVRGMHFQQPPHAEMKLISCLRGEVFDVAVENRKPPDYLFNFKLLLLCRFVYCNLIIN